MEVSKRVWNINVGVLGHVDSGKTALVAALSTKLSTAALDKHPQSKERGITLDLGFSSFTMPLPERLAQQPFDEVQVTLVDCPGHASLIRTIIGGAQIVDMAILVVDITKGIQAQTAECLVVSELVTDHLVVVLNKVDLLPAEQRDRLVAKARKRLAATFALTKFKGCAMVPVAAKPGGGDEEAKASPVGIDQLRQELAARLPPWPRSPDGPFLFAVDHCFAIRGQGTVLTGTVLQGSLKVNDALELPQLRLRKKVRSMQMFRRPVQRCAAGDRVGVCVTQLDPGLVERCVACAPGSVPTFAGAIAAVEKIRFFQGTVASKTKVHVTIGHVTVMAELLFFGVPDGAGEPGDRALDGLMRRISSLTVKGNGDSFDFGREYAWQEQLYGLEGRPPDPVLANGTAVNGAAEHADSNGDADSGGRRHFGPQWVYLKLSQPVTAPADALVIGARFDADVSTAACRLAFYGRAVALVDPADAAALARLRVAKLKAKRGVIERVGRDGRTAICRGMFKKETDLALFRGMKVATPAGEVGTIEGTFGKSGKFTVQFPDGLRGDTSATPISLVFKKLIFSPDKRTMMQ